MRAELGPLLLVPTSDTTFFSPACYTEVRVIRAADGSAEALEWRLEDASGRWNRVEPASPLDRQGQE